MNSNKQALFRPGINMRLLWSNHNCTALSTGVNAPKTHWGRIEIRSLKPHSEVVWTTYGHILSIVWPHMWPGPHYAPPTQLTSSSWAEARMLYSVIINNNRQQDQQQPAIFVDGNTWNSLSEFHLGWIVSTTETGWFTSQPEIYEDFWKKVEGNG